MKRLDVTVQSFGWSDRAKVRLLSPWFPVGGSVGQLLLLSLSLSALILFWATCQLTTALTYMIIGSSRFMFADDSVP